MIFSFLIPYKRRSFVLNLSEGEFFQKLGTLEEKLKEEYVPGTYYILHEKDKKFFLYKNVKFNTSKESGVISKFRYRFQKGKTVIESSFRYATIFYFFMAPFFLLIPVIFLNLLVGILPLGAYALFCFFLHLEAWVVSDEFKIQFEKEILPKEESERVLEYSR